MLLKRLQRRACERYENLSKEEKEKNKNMNANNIKISPKMKNKGRMLAVP